MSAPRIDPDLDALLRDPDRLRREWLRTLAENERLRAALERAITYVELTYDEEQGEEAAEAKYDLDFCRQALSPDPAAPQKPYGRYTCPTCDGGGEIAPSAECPDCDGTGACVLLAPADKGGRDG